MQLCPLLRFAPFSRWLEILFSSYNVHTCLIESNDQSWNEAQRVAPSVSNEREMRAHPREFLMAPSML